MRLERGTLVLISLDPTRGHEQRGTRPCVVVSDAEISADQRYPLIAVVPVSGTLIRFFLAASIPFLIAEGTSFALPTPKPTTP